jgi:hypothetical protein
VKGGHEFQQGGLGDLPLDLETGHRATNPVQVRAGQARPVQRQDLRARADRGPRQRVALKPWNFQTIAGVKQYLNASETRCYLLVQNNSAASLWMNFGIEAGNGIGIEIVSGGSGEWYASMFGPDAYGPVNSLYFWAAAAGGIFTVVEG